MLWLKVHSHRLLTACLLGSKRNLPSPACQVQLALWSAIQGACSSLATCTSVIRVLCQELEPTAFFTHPVLAAKMLLLPTTVPQPVQENWPELCRRSRPVPQIMIFFFPAFSLSPFSSIASFQVKSLLTHSSSNLVRLANWS